jgi:hypothetical protein
MFMHKQQGKREDNDVLVRAKRAQHQEIVHAFREGYLMGSLETYREIMIIAIVARFPALIDLAYAQLAQVDDADKLRYLTCELFMTHRQQTARLLLEGATTPQFRL